MSYKKRSRGYRGKNRAQNTGSFDPTRLIQELEHVSEPKSKAASITHTFADFNFVPSLTKAIAEKGYHQPTPIQDQIIPHIMDQKDVIGIANTGTGKTASFLLPLIHAVVLDKNTRVLIIAPTRELAIQIKNELQSFSKSLTLRAALCIGGTPLHRQTKTLQKRPQFVIGTPGRIIDLAKRKELYFNDFSRVVLDEVDRMLDMGFITDVRYIVENLPAQKQALFFSATLPPKLDEIIETFMDNPTKIVVQSQPTAHLVQQKVLRVGNISKIDLLHSLLDRAEYKKVLVFGRTKRGLNKLSQKLIKRGFSIATIHGNKSQNQRQRALKQFRTDKVRVLLATDVASRGLDISNITHVINYDLPQTKEDYIHRIGRTGRANSTGVAVSLVE